MAIDFNVQQTFEIAEKIEQNGQKFYERAVEIVDDPECKEFLKKLAEMERGHEKEFNLLKQKFFEHHDEEDKVEEKSVTSFFLQQVANGNIFDISISVDDVLTSDSSVEEILKIAIENEKNSVIFYEAIKESSLNTYWKKEIQDIIDEELKHIVELSQWLKKATA